MFCHTFLLMMQHYILQGEKMLDCKYLLTFCFFARSNTFLSFCLSLIPCYSLFYLSHPLKAFYISSSFFSFLLLSDSILWTQDSFSIFYLSSNFTLVFCCLSLFHLLSTFIFHYICLFLYCSLSFSVPFFLCLLLSISNSQFSVSLSP